jgi:hypothetical protein
MEQLLHHEPPLSRGGSVRLIEPAALINTG